MTDLDNVQRALEALKQGRLREQILRTCRHCGMTSQELILLECPDAGEALLKKTLQWLSQPNAQGFPALLEALPMKIEGRSGRPPMGYLLTSFGKDTYETLDPEISVRLNNPRDAKDLAHRFIELLVVTSALRNGWKVEVEKVLPYEGGEVRCDVYVEDASGHSLYIEIEQELRRNNAARARQKFCNWLKYARDTNTTPDMFFFFNLPESKLAATLRFWETAFGQAYDEEEDEAYFLDVRYVHASALEGHGLEEILEPQGIWIEPPYTPAPEEDAGAAALKPQGQPAAPGGFRLPDASELLPGLDDRTRAFQTARYPKERLQAFFDLMEYIYGASYGTTRSGQSDAHKYCLLPEKSLWLLRHYMNLPQNQSTYEELKQALIWSQRRSGSGLIMLRNTISGIFWDTFLKHHQIAMGGALQVTVDVPDYDNFNSTFMVKARFWDSGNDVFISDYSSKNACEALSWVLSAFFLYPEVMETGDKPWKQKEKAKKGKKHETAG